MKLEDKILKIYMDGPFSIPASRGPFAKHIGQTKNNANDQSKALIIKLQGEVLKHESKAISHELKMMFEQMTPLSLVRDLTLFRDRVSDQELDSEGATKITAYYESTLKELGRSDVIDTVLNALKIENILDIISVVPLSNNPEL
jgi:hypothetical protein